MRQSLEMGALHEIRDMLGHANIDQTDTCLNARKMRLHPTMRRLDASHCDPAVNEVETGQPLAHDAPFETTAEVTAN